MNKFCTDYGAVWIFNTKTEEWYKPQVKGNPPSPRRAHDALLDSRRNRICFFGGGNGQKAVRLLVIQCHICMTDACIHQLNDLALLDVSDPHLETVTWVLVTMPNDIRPPPRGYHTF